MTAVSAAVDGLIADLGAAPYCDRFDDHVNRLIEMGLVTESTTAAAEAPAPAVTTPTNP